MKCKLCESTKLVKIASYSVKDIQSFYNIDISKYFDDEYFDLYMCLNCELRSFFKVKPGDSDFYDYLQNMPQYYEQNKPEFTKALKLLKEFKPKKILEIGAGKGFFLDKIKNSFDVRASELSTRSILYLKEKNIPMDKAEDKYDFIFAFQVLEHIDNLRDFLNFIDLKLESGGIVFITVPNNDSPYFQEVFDYLDYPPHHMHQFNEYSLKYVAKIMNYEILEYWIEPIRIEHYFAIIRHRRKKLMRKFRLLSKIFSIIDYLLVPYHYNSELIGHTHGLLMKKNVY